MMKNGSLDPRCSGLIEQSRRGDTAVILPQNFMQARIVAVLLV
jgi:hypothetical protein